MVYQKRKYATVLVGSYGNRSEKRAREGGTNLSLHRFTSNETTCDLLSNYGSRQYEIYTSKNEIVYISS